MADQGTTGEQRVALISGAARRVGAGIARHLHARGLRVVLHYRGSLGEAEALAAELNAARPDSARLLQGDLLDTAALPALAARAVAAFGRLDGLVNNASSFFPTEVGRIDEAAWHDLMGSNLKAPLFLSQALAPELAKRRGAIVGIADPHARSREQETLEVACEAYSRLDISELIDIHDRVQDLVAMARRDQMEPDEHMKWRTLLGELYDRHPLRHAEVLASPEGISARMEMLKRKIGRQQEHLELSGMVYSAAVKTMRYRN